MRLRTKIVLIYLASRFSRYLLQGSAPGTNRKMQSERPAETLEALGARTAVKKKSTTSSKRGGKKVKATGK
jgi:hypothetical protein